MEYLNEWQLQPGMRSGIECVRYAFVSIAQPLYTTLSVAVQSVLAIKHCDEITRNRHKHKHIQPFMESFFSKVVHFNINSLQLSIKMFSFAIYFSWKSEKQNNNIFWALFSFFSAAVQNCTFRNTHTHRQIFIYIRIQWGCLVVVCR